MGVLSGDCFDQLDIPLSKVDGAGVCARLSTCGLWALVYRILL